MADSSFDVVSKVDRQEVDNALNQAAKELSQRYDFRGTNTGIEWSGEENIVITSDAEERAQAGLEVFKENYSRYSMTSRVVPSPSRHSVGRPGRPARPPTSADRHDIPCRTWLIHPSTW